LKARKNIKVSFWLVWGAWGRVSNLPSNNIGKLPHETETVLKKVGG
jgi:hypothetical protein